MDSTVEASMLQAATQVARAYARRYQWVEQAELEQEAWVAMLEALPRYDSSRGELAGYLYGTAQRVVHRYVWRSGSPWTVKARGAGQLSRASREAQQARAEFHEVDAAPGEEIDLEEQYDRAQMQARITAMVGALLAQDKEAAAVLAVLRGEASPAAVAEAHDVRLSRLYKVTHKVRTALKDALAA